MISKWKASAKNLLYHFRCVLRGMVPFSPSWNPKKQKQVELDAMSLEYIQTMSRILGQRSKLMSSFKFTSSCLSQWQWRVLTFSLPHQKLNCLHCARKGLKIVMHDRWLGWLSCSSIDQWIWLAIPTVVYQTWGILLCKLVDWKCTILTCWRGPSRRVACTSP